MTSLPDMRGKAVVVVGDVMLDRFWSGPARRVSPEAPVPVVSIASQEDRAGGAANVAVNLAHLGLSVSLVGLAGEDEHGKALRGCVEQAGVRWNVMPCAASTIVKLRVLSRHQQLLRMDFEESLTSYADDLFAGYAQQHLVDADLVVFSDYAKGSLTMIDRLLAHCRDTGKRTLVDPKGTDFERYRGASILTPNLGELEAVVGNCPDDETLIEKASGLCETLELEAILVTRSEAGMTLVRRGSPARHFPARSKEVFDVTGAGDTAIAVMAGCLAAGASIEEATFFANVGAGVVVSKLGTSSVSTRELELAAGESTALEQSAQIVSEEALAAIRKEYSAAGRKVVMTNGCFDLIHPGHVRYLEQAAALGDVLVVAVNDDESVKRLKGNERPINPLASRMAVLAGLRSVDWVVSFSEDTPERLISNLLPDVLVKGGDYSVQEIAGHEAVQANGGDVIVLDFLPGHSTTDMIGRMID